MNSVFDGHQTAPVRGKVVEGDAEAAAHVDHLDLHIDDTLLELCGGFFV